MMHRPISQYLDGRLVVRLIAIAAMTFTSAPVAGQAKKTLTFTDLMKVRQIEQPSISADGDWVVFTAEPDRGDPEVVVRATNGDTRYVVPLGSNPVVATTGDYVAMRLNPSLEALDRAGARGNRPRRGVVLLNTANGSTETYEDIQSFAFSADGAWLVMHAFASEGTADAETPSGDREVGTELQVIELGRADLTVRSIENVRDYEVGDNDLIAYTVASADNARDGIYARRLGGVEQAIHSEPFGHYAQLTWGDQGSLAFVAVTEDEDGEPGTGSVMAWDGSTASTYVSAEDAPDDWTIPTNATLEWSGDESQLFFGWRPWRADELAEITDTGEEQADFDPYNLDAILEDRGVDVWHWEDSALMAQQKVMWGRESNRTYRAVYHADSGEIVRLADAWVPDLVIPDNGSVALARSDVPYQREATWEGGQRDLYAVNLANGERTRVVEKIRSNGQLSPSGNFIAYYHEGDYHFYDVAAGSTRNATADLGVPIANEDHDSPVPAPGYGIGGWLEGDAAALIYDKYDIWVVPTDGSSAWNLTEGAGRAEQRIFRIIDTDQDEDAIGPGDELLLSSYHDWNKNFGFYRAHADRPGATRLLEEERRFRYLSKAENIDRALFTREDYNEFPDLWVSDTDFGGAKKLTDVNPQIADFGWGTSELVEWRSLDGIPLQGVVIKPDNYEEGKQYPVLIYYYRFMTDRLHAFNDPSINHRPSFPVYASDGYVVFLPDVRFEVGRPGFASTKSVVPGVQHLIDIGLADPDAIALHGHSWSGYQTAFMVTQTDIFTTAIAGAPVGNMTSAYSGIRLGSGMARQFQYEKTQSRLSGNLWDARDEYIDNSPVFFADKINTPMLILHGDADDAVPWEQSIELFLAMRRLDKESVFLQYRGEPHHPRTYSNKLDWALKMKEWIDHYLKGTPAAAWITEGLPYSGR